MKKIRFILFLFLIVNFFAEVRAEEYFQVPAEIQISSTVSDGKLKLPEIVKIAKANNIKILVFTDRDVMKWEYGLWPLRRIIKKTVETNSVSKYGIKHYLEDIKKLQTENPDLVLIPGVESAPFYYWEGSPFKKNLKIFDWHKHMLVLGLEKEDDYRNLPSVSNENSLALPFRFKDVYRFWPVLILITGWLCIRKRKFRYKDLQGKSLGPYSGKWQAIGTGIIIVGLLFLYNNYPFCNFKYDQYHGDQNVIPYQYLIDYVNQRGGVTFWSHPEAEYIQKTDNIEIETREHANNLMEVSSYTGFAVFYEGYKKTGHPGGIWDDILKEYCQGRRKNPVWAIGGLSFEQIGDLGEYIKDLRNIFLVTELTGPGVLNALREGRIYVVRGKDSSQFVLDKFSVKDNSMGIEKTMGQQINMEGNPQLEIKGHFLNRQGQFLKIKLIKNGMIIKTFETVSSFDISYQDDCNEKAGKFYYRLEIEAPGLFLITNPIFVEFKKAKDI